MSRATTLAASDIGVRIAGREILRDVALTISPGELIAVAGPNGAGKSTLLRVLAGLTQPDTGSVRLGDMDVRTMDRRSLGRAIAYLPQDRTVHWPLKVRAVVALGRIPHADRSIGELSGGERARVLIARALAQDAGILIADEPAAGLDPAHALALFETFVAIAAQGRAVIVALHDLSLALRYCPRTLLLKDGEVAASGHARDVLTEPMIARVYGITATIAEIAGVPCVIPVSVRP